MIATIACKSKLLQSPFSCQCKGVIALVQSRQIMDMFCFYSQASNVDGNCASQQYIASFGVNVCTCSSHGDHYNLCLAGTHLDISMAYIPGDQALHPAFELGTSVAPAIRSIPTTC